MIDVDMYRIEFESEMPTDWSFEKSTDPDDDVGYNDDLTQGAFIGWLIAKKIINVREK